MVIAEPAPAPVERDDEEGRLLERFEPARRSLAPTTEHGVAERSRHGVEHGRPREEAQIGAPEARQVLEVEVVGHEPIRAGELSGGGRGVGRALEHEAGKVQPRRPALRPLCEVCDLRLLELELSTAEQQLRLAAAQRQVVGADLEQAARSALPRDGQGQRASRQDERGSLRHVPGERGDRPCRLRRPERVHVVEHEHDRRRDPGECRRQPGHRGRPGRSRRCCERVEDGRRDRLHPVQRGSHVPQQDEQVVVALVDRHPGEGPFVTFGPLRQQGRLPESGRGDDRDHVRGPRRAQPVDETGARDGPSADPRHRVASLRGARAAPSASGSRHAYARPAVWTGRSPAGSRGHLRLFPQTRRHGYRPVVSRESIARGCSPTMTPAPNFGVVPARSTHTGAPRARG